MSGYKQPGAKYRYLNGDDAQYHTAQRKDGSEPKGCAGDEKKAPSSQKQDEHSKSIESNNRVSKAVPNDHKGASAESVLSNLQHSPVLVLAVGAAAISWWYLSAKV